MSEEAHRPDEPPSPDVQKLSQLIRLMHRYDLTAIDLGEGANKIRLRRRTGTDARPAVPPPPPPVNPAPAMYHPAPGTSPPTAVAVPTTPAPEAPKGVFIESPMVGTFYSASSPDAPPFVQVGSTVRADTTVCIIEAMKVFTDIPAGLSGTILEILVKSGQPVEFGQPLFRIEPA